jgi:predicted enzyme related to lactoylglutathione lyase
MEAQMTGDPIVCWELASHDEAKSADFFRKVFDWEVPFDDKLGFYRVKSPGTPTCSRGLIFTLRQAKLPFLTIYIGVKDIDAKRRLVVENGGFIVIEPFDIGDGERICLFNEPSGVTFAMIQEKSA